MTDIITRREPAHAPAPARGQGLLTFTLWFALLDMLFFGASNLFAPEYVVETLAESTEFSYFAMRWSGGLVIGLALGCIYMLRRPAGQMPMFTTFATGATLAGIGFFWSWLAEEYAGNDWYLVAALVGTFGLGLLMWITRFVSRELLD